MKKRVFCLVLSVVLLLSVFSVAYAAEGDPADSPTNTGGESVPVAEDFQEVASNKNFTLYFRSSDCYVGVKDKRTGMTWYSNPIIEDDPVASGIAVTNLKSQLLITYTNKNKTKETQINSSAGCVRGGSVNTTKITNGIRVDYVFGNEKIKIPVTYVLDEEGLNASVLTGEVTEENNQLLRVELLQYFGAGSTQDNGYIFVPDGSGAVINFNNGKTNKDLTYSKPVYGEDLSLRTNTGPITSRAEEITLPVFGLVNNGAGFLAEITNGAELAAINAGVSGTSSSYNNVSSTLTYRSSNSLPLQDQTDNSQNVIYNALHPTVLSEYTVKYRFLDSQNVTYSDLANLYRETLKKEGVTKTADVTNRLFVEFYGGVRKKKSFIGFIYNAKEKLTTFEEAQGILQDLKDSGVNQITAVYENYADDFFSRNIQVGINPVGTLGGKGGFTKLLEYGQQENIGIYPAVNFTTMPTGGNGFSTFFDVSSALNVSPVLVYRYKLNTNMKDSSVSPSYLLSASKFGKAADKILDTMNKNNYNTLYFNREAQALYSDFAKDGYLRDQAKQEMIAQFERLAEGHSITLSNPNAFLMQFADYITDLPLSSSQNTLFDYDVPFLQMVLKGTKAYSGKSININDMSQETFLKHIEYGADIKYSLIKADTTKLLDTDSTFLYSATYDTFKDQIVDRYAQVESIGKQIGDATITSHQMKDQVAVVRYSNGRTIYVNYNDSEAEVDGVSIPANSYVVA